MGISLELRVSVLPYERTAKPSPKNQPRSDGVYLKDYDSTQEFGFFRKCVELSRDAGGYTFPEPRCNKTRNWRVLFCFVAGAAGL
ncbi:hypothetical protein [Pseudomonas fluorescens]